ncbi:hypothetical protein JTB14_007425 [Gonioctena quinquepunctata]|nr:hypothetical protein JTB14_007425 [Gonioctena quinquepunctata]
MRRKIFPSRKKSVGSVRPILLEFVRYIKKQGILAKANNLKGSRIGIANDLITEDREINKTLTKHYRLAKEKNYEAEIYEGYLYMNGKKYSAEQLEKQTTDIETPEKNQRNYLSYSAPPTPSTDVINKSEFQQEIFTPNKVEKPEATKKLTANPIPLNNLRPRNKSITQTDRNSSKTY